MRASLTRRNRLIGYCANIVALSHSGSKKAGKFRCVYVNVARKRSRDFELEKNL